MITDNPYANIGKDYWKRKRANGKLKNYVVVIETHLNKKSFSVLAIGRTDASHQAIAKYKQDHPNFYGEMDITVSKP